MNTTIEYLELLHDALKQRASNASDNDDYSLEYALKDAAESAESLIRHLRELERFA